MPDQPEFDHEAYGKTLEILVDHAQKEYKLTALERPAFQISILRNYLWLSSVLVAAELAIFKALLEKSIPLSFLQKAPGAGFYHFAIPAILAGLACFLFGVDTMRGRSHRIMPYGDFMGIADMAYKEAFGTTAKETMLTTLLQALNNAISHHAVQTNQLGGKLRTMSWGLCSSLILGLLAIAAFAWS